MRPRINLDELDHERKGKEIIAHTESRKFVDYSESYPGLLAEQARMTE